MPQSEDVPNRSEETQFRYDLAMGKTRQLGDRLIERLRRLNEQYPSDELAEAIHSLEQWRGRLHSP